MSNTSALLAIGVLSAIQRKTATTIERISTGIRINSSKDDAAGLVISQKMTTRIQGLHQTVRSINDGVSLLQTAEGGLSSITDMLQRMRELGVQSSSGTYNESDRAALSIELAARQSDISKLVSGTNFKNITLLNGSFANKLIQIGTNPRDSISINISSAALTDIATASFTQTTQVVLSEPPNPSPLITKTAQYIEYTDLGSADETLSLNTSPSPDTTNDAISIFGTDLYLGNGTTATQIGNVDSQFDGTNGKALRINLQQQFSNSTFDNGVAGSSSFQGWTALNQRVRLDGTSTVAGWPTPTDPTTAPDGGTESASGNGTFTSTLSAQTATNSGLSAVLVSNLSGVTNSPTQGVGGVLHGPVLFSDTSIPLNQGDTISFEWKAQGGSDAFDVYAYILDTQTGHTEELLNETGTSASDVRQWTTVSHTVTSAGDYKFVFVSGSWDATGGRAAGAQLYIDNVTANSTSYPVLTSNQLSELTSLVSYQNATPINASVTINGVAVSSGPSASVAESSANLEQAIQNLISAGTIQDIALSRAGNEITLRSTTAGSLFSVTDTSQTSSKVLAMRIETPTIPDIDISSSDLASSAISAINIAINAIIKSRASVGAYINTLAHVGDNISNSMQQTIASRSTIMDTDYAIETSHLAKSQIIQDAANAMLVHANLQTLNVLELFKSH